MAIIGKMSDPFHVETSRTADNTQVTLECWRNVGVHGWRSVEKLKLPVLDDEDAHNKAIIDAAQDMLQRATSG